VPGAVLVVLAATAVLVELVVGRGAGTPPPLSGSALRSYTVVYTGQKGVEVVPLDGQHPRYPMSTDAGPPVGTSAGVAFVHAGTAYLLTPPYDARPRPLLVADGLFPMVWPDMLGADRGVGTGNPTAVYVNLEQAGSPALPGWQFPPGYRPVGQFFALGPGGLLRDWLPGPGGQVELGRAVGHAAAVIGTVNSSLMWLSAGTCAPNGECTLHLTTSDDGAPDVDHVVQPPPGHDGFLAGGAGDPNGTLIAAFVAGSRDHAALAIIDTGILDSTIVSDSVIAVGHAAPTARWTPDSAYVLFSGPRGAMHAYAPGSSRAVSLDFKGSSSFFVG
jgi:hypothetical protein